MSTLLLRLAAPLQSWGVGAKFDRRETQRLPTKSGVVGLLAAALGRKRTDSLEDLNALSMGVRADQEGELLRDYHTARTEKSTYVTNRYYLADAVFLVGLQGEEDLLRQLAQALQNPAFPLFLGRRSCPPEGRVMLGIREGKSLAEALEQEPWLASPWYRKKHQDTHRLQVLLEAYSGSPGSFYLRDVPLSFDQAHRQHGFRSVRVGSICLPGDISPRTPAGVDVTEHDALADWGV